MSSLSRRGKRWDVETGRWSVHSDRITQRLLDRAVARLADVVVVQPGVDERVLELGVAEVHGRFAVHLVELGDAG